MTQSFLDRIYTHIRVDDISDPSEREIMLQLCSFRFDIYRGGGVNGSGGAGDHKSAQHNQQSTGGRAEHRSGLGDQPGQYATLSKQCKTLESSDFY